MVWLLRSIVIWALLALGAQCATGQDQIPGEKPEDYEFVSGIVAEFSDSRIVVNRAVLGKPAENREFLITAETKVEGRLRNGVRVTVGFKPTEHGDVAMRIIVRPQNGTPPK